MNVLVTGGAGYIGSVCVRELVRAGHSVTVFDNLSEGHRAAVDPAATFIRGDLGHAEQILAAVRDSRAEAVIHFAAHALVGESMTHPTKYFRNNIAAGINLLDAAAQCGVRKIVFSSSCATYGIPDRVPIDESFPTRPVNPYGESKLAFERLLPWYERIHGLGFVVFRYFNAAGAADRLGEHHRVETHLIPNVLRVALGQAPHCEVFGTDYATPDGTCLRDYVHVLDLADAHIRALDPAAGGCFNLATGHGTSVREVIRACEKISGRAIRVVEKPRRAGDPPALVATPARAERELGWKARFTEIGEIVATAWEWHAKHPQGYAD